MELTINQLKELILEAASSASGELETFLETNLGGAENRYVRQLVLLELTGVKYDLKKCTIAKLKNVAQEMAQVQTAPETTHGDIIAEQIEEIEVEQAQQIDSEQPEGVQLQNGAQQNEATEIAQTEQAISTTTTKAVASKASKQNLAYGERYLEIGEFANALQIIDFLEAHPDTWFKSRKNGELSRQLTVKFIFENSQRKEQKVLFAELKGDICVFLQGEYDKAATTPLRMSDSLQEFLQAIEQLPPNAELRLGKVEKFDYGKAIQAIVFTHQNGEQSSGRLAVLEKYYTLQIK